MIHAYDKMYLSVAQRNLGHMLDYLVRDVQISLTKAWQYFLLSPYALRFAKGDPSVLVGVSGVELAQNILNQTTPVTSYPSPTYSYERSSIYWTGWAIAYYQWDTGLSFTEIEDICPIEEIEALYQPYHEMDIRHFVNYLNGLYYKAKPTTHLQTLRKMAGLTQAELAQAAQISLRTLQQYEQRQKDINKAQAETLLRLSRVLHCNIEDLLEKIPMPDVS